MTEYSDIPDVSILYQQREVVTQAIAGLDAGGNITNLTIGVEDQSGAMTQMPVSVQVPPPTPANVLADVREWLVARQADLDDQLAALGVTNSPARSK